MINPITISSGLEHAFQAIHQKQMQGLPLLNPAIRVEAVGFRRWGSFNVGVMVTPWFMNLMLLPPEGDDWTDLEVGSKQPYRFPEREYEMSVNEFDGVGRCLTFPLHSPMHEFDTHDIAVAVAKAFLDVLMTEKADGEPSVEEARFGRFLSGEEMAAIRAEEEVRQASEHNCQRATGAEQPLTRRDLLRGAFGAGAE